MSQRFSGRWFKTFAVFTAGMCFFSNAVLLHAAESNLWKERRGQASLAAAPSQPSLSTPSDTLHILKGLPDLHAVGDIASSVWARLSADVPADVLRKNAALLKGISPVHGNIRRLSLPRRDLGRTVVFLQDVHNNDEAQANLGGIVDSLISSREDGAPLVGLVALEAAFAPLALDKYRALEDQAALRAAADYALQEHGISGPVHAAYVHEGSLPPFTGVDDRVHYDANIRAYRRSVSFQTEARFRVAARLYLLEREKKAVFNEDLLAFDRAVTARRKDNLSFGGYMEALVRAGGKESGQTALFLQSLRLEKSLDFKAVEGERSRLIEDVVRRLPRKDVDRLLHSSVAYRSGALSHTDYYQSLRDLCRRNGINLSIYPAMDSYLQYVLLAARIDAEKLFTEINGMEAAAYARLVKTGEERRLVAESRRLALTDKLLDFSLTPEEWQEFQAVLSSSPQGPVGGPSLDLSPFLSFYKEADARNHAMTDNLLKAMEAHKTDAAVFVAGGFHTRGMSELLTGRGVTVIEVSPKLTKVEGSASAYLGVFTQEKTPLEQIFKGNRLFVGDLANKYGESSVIAAIVALKTGSAELFGRLVEGARMVSLKIKGQRAEADIETAAGKAHVSLRGKDGGFVFAQRLSLGVFAAFLPQADTVLSQGLHFTSTLAAVSNFTAPGFLAALGYTTLGLSIAAVAYVLFKASAVKVLRYSLVRTASAMSLMLSLFGCGPASQTPAESAAQSDSQALTAVSAERLLDVLRDSDENVRRAAIDAYYLESAEDAAVLVGFLEAHREGELSRRRDVLFILGKWRAMHLVQVAVLAEALDDLPESNVEARVLAIRALADSEDAQALPAVLKVLSRAEKGHGAAHMAAVQSLGGMRGAGAVEALLNVLEHPGRYTRGYSHPDPELAFRLEAITGLSGMTEDAEKVVPALKRFLDDPHAEVRDAARRAVEMLTVVPKPAPGKLIDDGSPPRQRLSDAGLQHPGSDAPGRWAALYAAFPRQAKSSPVEAALELAGTMLLDGRLQEAKELLFQLLPDMWKAQATGDTTPLIDTWTREMGVPLETGEFPAADLTSFVELAESMAKSVLVKLREREADAALPAEVLVMLDAHGIKSPADFTAFIMKVKNGELTPDPKMMAALSGVLEMSLTSERATNLKEALATNRAVHHAERRFDSSSMEVRRDAEPLSALKWMNEPASLEALKVLHGEGIHTIGSLRRGVTARELAGIKGSSEDVALAVLNTLAVEGISLPPGSPKARVFHSVGAPAAFLASLVVQGGSVDGALLGAILLLGLSFPLYLRIKRAFEQRALSPGVVFATLAVLSVAQAVALCQAAGLEPLAWFWAFAIPFYAAQGLPLFFNPLRRWNRQVDDFLRQDHALDPSGWNVLDPAPLLDLVARLRADPAINRPGPLGPAAENLVARLRTAWEIEEMDARSLYDEAVGRGRASRGLADRIAALSPPAPLSTVDAETLLGRWVSSRPGDRAAQLRRTAAGQISLLSTRMPAEVFGEWKAFMEKGEGDRPLLAVLDLWGALWAPRPVLDGESRGFISELLAEPFFRWAHPRLHGVMAARFSNDGTGGDAVLERAVALYRAGRAVEGRAWAEAFFNDLTDARKTGDPLVLNEAWTARMENEPAVRLRAEDLPRLQEAAFRLMENDGLPAGDSPVHLALETAESFLRLGRTEEARELLMTLTSALWRAKESGDLKALFALLEATLHMESGEGRGSFLIEDLPAAILRVQSLALQLVLMTPKPAEDDSAFFAEMASEIREGSSRTLEEALGLNASLYASTRTDESVLEEAEARSPVASLPWEDDEISAEALEVLRTAGILTVGHLAALDVSAVLDLPGMEDEVALRILNVLHRELLPLRPQARVLHSMGGPVGFVGGLVAHVWGTNPFAGLSEMPMPQGGALAWGTAGAVVLYGSYKMAPYWRDFIGALMDGVGRVLSRVMDGRRAALALAALLAVSAAEGRAVAGKEELVVLAPEASSVGLDAFLSRRAEAGVPAGAALLKEVDHWAYRYNPVFRRTLEAVLREKRVALDHAAAAAAVSRAVEKEVPAGAAVAAGPGGVFVLTQVLRSEADIPGFTALLAKHKGSAAHVQVLAREEGLKVRVLAAFTDAGLEKVSLDFRASRDVPGPGSREGMSESVVARHAAPWLAELQRQGVRPGTVPFYVSYPADLELLEGDVPELFRRWSAERIRSFLEKAFVVKYQDLNSIGWMARLIAQMA